VHAAEVVLKSPPLAALAIAAIAVTVGVIRVGSRKYGRLGEVFERATVGALMVVLFVPMSVHRAVFDRIFLRLGKYKG
jgi:hypothetical protein